MGTDKLPSPKSSAASNSYAVKAPGGLKIPVCGGRKMRPQKVQYSAILGEARGVDVLLEGQVLATPLNQPVMQTPTLRAVVDHIHRSMNKLVRKVACVQAPFDVREQIEDPDLHGVPSEEVWVYRRAFVEATVSQETEPRRFEVNFRHTRGHKIFPLVKDL